MTTRPLIRRSLSLFAAVLVSLGVPVGARSTELAGGPIAPPPGNLRPRSGEHPLLPVIRWGQQGIEAFRRIDDYTCTLVKRERVAGRLRKTEWMELKVRHRPFSVYARFFNGSGKTVQEVIYVEGRDDGKLWAHSDRYQLLGTLALVPDSTWAMRESRYPITEAGVLRLMERLVALAQENAAAADCEVQLFEGARIESRPSRCIAVTHPQEQPGLRFHHARLYIDEAWNIPVRFESYYWPREPGGPPQLLEEYTYLNFRFNPGLDERDFDRRNLSYQFPREPRGDAATARADVPPAGPVHETAKPAMSARPLEPAIQLVRQSLTRMKDVRDYSCLFSKREEVQGKLTEHEHMRLKVRHGPFSIYAQFLGPQQPAGQELIYVEGRHDGLLVVQPGGIQGRIVGTVRLRPDNPLVMRGNRHPITNIGMQHLLREVYRIYQQEQAREDCLVRYYYRAKVDDRLCTCIEVVHPTPGDDVRFHRTRLYLDDQSKLPLRFEAYRWPKSPGEKPPLVEEYTYRQLRVNVGFTEQDFDPDNPSYAFASRGP